MQHCVYRTENNLNAHLVQAVLAQADIESHITGEYLQGGVGELAARDFIEVRVQADDKEVAIKVVMDWEATPIEVSVDKLNQSPRGAWLVWLAIAALLLGVLLQLLLT